MFPGKVIPAGRRLALYATGIALPMVVFLLLLEGTMQLLPVPSALKTPPVNADNPVYRLRANREFVNSMGWSLEAPVTRRVNNEGFVNDQDYVAGDTRPLLAVVGDSYVEANYIPYEETINAALAGAAGTGRRVYSFGVSGGPLSQYLVWADHARARFAPSHMVFVIIANDFDESLAAYRVFPGFHHFVDSEDGALTLQRFDFEVSQVRALVRNSALARYLFYNVRLPARLRVLFGEDDYAGNTAASAEARRIADSERAVAAFLDLLPGRSGLPRDRILFLVDGLRPELYDPAARAAAAGSYAARMFDHFIAEARARGYETADLEPRFRTAFERDGERFEFTYDAHWNGHGHRVAADAVIGSALFRDFLGR